MGFTGTHKRRDGSVEYTEDGVLHRKGGPARIDADGTKNWYEAGVRHRDDGPAVERRDGTTEWWRHGFKVTASITDAFATAQEDDDAGRTAVSQSKKGIAPVRSFQLNMHKK